MAKRENSEISFRILKNSGIPAIVRPKRESRYQSLIKALMENPNVPIEFWNGSTSGLRNAVKRELPPEIALQMVIVERKRNGRTHKYAIYDQKGEYVRRKKVVKQD